VRTDGSGIAGNGRSSGSKSKNWSFAAAEIVAGEGIADHALEVCEEREGREVNAKWDSDALPMGNWFPPMRAMRPPRISQKWRKHGEWTAAAVIAENGDEVIRKVAADRWSEFPDRSEGGGFQWDDNNGQRRKIMSAIVISPVLSPIAMIVSDDCWG
jgi:hypothetical protein